MHICIIGHGSMGLLWAHHLQQKHHHITLLSRRENLPSAQQQLLALEGESTTRQLTFSRVYPQDAELVIVTTKAYQVQQAITPWLTEINCPIILLHNGMGTVDALALSPHHQIILATTTHGAMLTDHKLRHTGRGYTTLGNWINTKEHVLQHCHQILDSALPPVAIHANIAQPLLLKLAINCVINPLTALAQCKNGQLQQAHFQQQINVLIGELQQVISQLDPSWPYSEASLKERIMEVVIATADNYSSMAQDVKYQRPTEIAFINGYIIEQAKRLAIDVTENKKIFSQVSALQS